jgi:hypothetical protein
MDCIRIHDRTHLIERVGLCALERRRAHRPLRHIIQENEIKRKKEKDRKTGKKKLKERRKDKT